MKLLRNFLHKIRKKGIHSENLTEKVETVQEINDQDILEKLAKEHSCIEVRASAIKYVHNNELGLSIALSDTSKFVRREALKHIENNQLLGYIFLNDDFYVATGAIKEIDEIPILKRIKRKTKTEKKKSLIQDRIHQLEN